MSQNKAGIINGIDFDAKLDALKATKEYNLKYLTEEEIRTLDKLLGKLWSELGSRYIISPNHLGENTYIATYDKDGNRIKVGVGYDVKTALNNML